MTCHRPLQALRLPDMDNQIVIVPKAQRLQIINSPNYLQLPCGTCLACSLSYSLGWSVRCCHEASLYEYNSFVTLTYNDYFNERNGFGLNYRDVVLFLKRLRKALHKTFNDFAFDTDLRHNLRFFMCGEYGSKTYRPHFHLLFFNLDFYDKKLHSIRNGIKNFVSDTLSSFWTDPLTGESYGHAVLGQLTVASAAYVARYSAKKFYERQDFLMFNHNTGEFLPREKTNMSRRPGTAYDWFKAYRNSV